MGAAIALEMAATQPERASALVLVDPIPIVPLPALADQRAGLLAALEGPGYAAAFRAFAETRMFQPTDDPAIRARIVEDMCAIPQPLLASAFASINHWSGERLAHQLRCPVLLITAGDGLPADLARTRELIIGLEHGRTVGAGHFAHVFAPTQVNAMIEQFLAVTPSTR
jgi:pimeloyl-ACP methyl ester carboxylesterase